MFRKENLLLSTFDEAAKAKEQKRRVVTSTQITLKRKIPSSKLQFHIFFALETKHHCNHNLSELFKMFSLWLFMSS